MESLLDILGIPSILVMESKLDMAPVVTNRLKERRTERGWTQQDLADAVRVSRQSINSIERQRYEPSLALALRFARVFGCAMEDLFSLQEKR
jgi:putative transcriptional regulator